MLASALSFLFACSTASAEWRPQDEDTCPNPYSATDQRLLKQTVDAALRGCIQGGWAGLWLQFNSPFSYLSELKNLAFRYDGPYRLLEEKRGLEVISELTGWLLPHRTNLLTPRQEISPHIGYGLGVTTCALTTAVLSPYFAGGSITGSFLKQIFFPRLERIHTIAHITEDLVEMHQSNVGGATPDRTSRSGVDEMYAATINLGFMSFAAWQSWQAWKANLLLRDLFQPGLQLNPVFFTFEMWILWRTLHELKPTKLAAWVSKPSPDTHVPTPANMTSHPSDPFTLGHTILSVCPSQEEPPSKTGVCPIPVPHSREDNKADEQYTTWLHHFSLNQAVDSIAATWLALSIPVQVWDNPFNLHSTLDLIECLSLQKAYSSMPNIEKLAQCVNPFIQEEKEETQTSP